MNPYPVKKAMVLAAGFGTRLKPLTDNLPKALVTYNGKPMIENVIEKLYASGIDEITINTHHFADKIADYFSSKAFSVKINVLHEKEILGTGGAVKNARKFLAGTGDFIVHNVDVDSGISLASLYGFHSGNNALATLCVKNRETSRYLLTDNNGMLAGRELNGVNEIYKPSDKFSKTAFCGVYFLSDKVFDLFPPVDNFDIIPFLLEMVKNGENIICYDIGNTFWKDLGRAEKL